MAKLRLPTVLRPLADGCAVLEIEAADLASLATELRRRYPALAERVYDGDGSWRDFVSVFVDGEDARSLDRRAPIRGEVQLLPAISGGSGDVRAAGRPRERTADPYRDTDVIDAYAPRANQTVIGIVSILAVLTGWWPLLGLLAAQLAIGLTFGRRYCLACLLYFELIQPRIGEGPIEDSRPPRFANVVGAVVLTAATAAYLFGAVALGAGLGVVVAALALLAAGSGLCIGCEMYKIGARLRGISRRRFDRVDLAQLGVTDASGDLVVQFTHPLCTDCRELERDLRAAGRRVVTVDVSRRPELARRYGVAYVPTAVAVDTTGAVTARIAG
jgi:molybdopterin converting factor small subunit